MRKHLIYKFRDEITGLFGFKLEHEPLKCIKSVLIYTREDSGQRVLPPENLKMIQEVFSQNMNLDVSVISRLNNLSFVEQVEE